MKRRDIRLLSQEELREAVVAMGEKAFRSKQLEEWIWTKSASSFEEMSNLSKGFRS
jgi:23S rRNA (adenine2503-C2)-methyltransferase